MQPWLQPMQCSTSAARAARGLATRSGSAIIARVMPIDVGLAVGQQPLGVGEVDHARRGDHRHAGQRGADGAGGLGDRVALDAAAAARSRPSPSRRRSSRARGRRSRPARRRRAPRAISRAGGRVRARRWVPRRRPAARRRRRRSPAASRTAVEHLAREPQAVLAASYSSSRRFERRREELRDQVAVRHRHLDAVDPALAGLARRSRRRPRCSRRCRARVSARGSTWNRGDGTADGATAAGSRRRR